MKLLNLNMAKELSIIILLSFAITACGSGSGSPVDIQINNPGTVTPPGTTPPPGAVPPPGTVPPPPTTNAPTVNISAASTQIPYNTSTSITWSSTNSTSCSSSPSGITGVSGTYTTPRLTTTTTYIVTCAGADGTAIGSVKIAVAPSVITAFADAGNGNTTVTSANTLSNGAFITIGGTSNYNGTYTVTNVSSTTFVITKPFIANDATGVWQMAGGMISGCTTAGNTGAIALANNPSRFIGVAPLSVFFDAADTTATSTARPFHDLEYRWDFGDPDGSPVNGKYWKNGSKPGASRRNMATGPLAAHVFEVPGVYTVALSATDGTSTVSNSCAQIVVQDPDLVFAGANTICVGATSVPAAGTGAAGDCPVGANRVAQTSFPAAISSYAKTGKRVLFKRGDTFTASSSAGISVTGPGTIGAFGSGALPVVQGNSDILTLSGGKTATITDWRIMDLEFDGAGIVGNGGIDQLTLLRLSILNAGMDMTFSVQVLDYWNNNGSSGHYLWDQLAIVDNTITNNSRGGGVYIGGRRFTFAGNLMDDAVASQHVARFPQIVKGVVSNNTLGKQAPDKHIVKLHGPTWSAGTPPSGVATDGINTFGYTEQVLIADNKFIPGAAPWAVSLEPQNAQYDERLRNVIVERNWFTESSSSGVSLLMSGLDMTARNNIFSMVNGNTAINIGKRGVEPPATNANIYNNSMYSSASGSFSGVFIGSDNINPVVKNNLAYAPNGSSPVMIQGSGASGLVSSNNSTNSGVKSTSPLFTVTPPANPADFKPAAGSYAISGGTDVPVWSDFFMTAQTATRDLGAVIH